MTPSITFDRTRGVSPVVGVVLLVAIVVILASTVGVFVLGLAEENQTTTPTVVIDAESGESSRGDDILTLTVESGDVIDTENLDVRLKGARHGSSPDATDINQDEIDNEIGSELRAGESFVVGPDTTTASGGSGLDLSDATVRFVWEDGGSSDVLWTWTAE